MTSYIPIDEKSKAFEDGYQDGYNGNRNNYSNYYRNDKGYTNPINEDESTNYSAGINRGRYDKENGKPHRFEEDELENETEFKSLKNKGGRKSRKARKTRKSKKHSKKTRKHRK